MSSSFSDVLANALSFSMSELSRLSCVLLSLRNTHTHSTQASVRVGKGRGLGVESVCGATFVVWQFIKCRHFLVFIHKLSSADVQK